MSSDKEKRSKAEALLSQFKQETSKIEGLDPAIQQYLDQRFDRIEEMLEKILKRMNDTKNPVDMTKIGFKTLDVELTATGNLKKVVAWNQRPFFCKAEYTSGSTTRCTSVASGLLW